MRVSNPQRLLYTQILLKYPPRTPPGPCKVEETAVAFFLGHFSFSWTLLVALGVVRCSKLFPTYKFMGKKLLLNFGAKFQRYSRLRFIQIPIISLALKLGKLLEFGQNAYEIIP